MKRYEKGTFRRLFTYSKDVIWIFVLAVFTAILNGSVLPVFAIFLSKMLTTLIQFSTDKVQARKDSDSYALIIFIAGIVIWLSWFFQIFLFGIVG